MRCETHGRIHMNTLIGRCTVRKLSNYKTKWKCWHSHAFSKFGVNKVIGFAAEIKLIGIIEMRLLTARLSSSYILTVACSSRFPGYSKAQWNSYHGANWVGISPWIRAHQNMEIWFEHNLDTTRWKSLFCKFLKRIPIQSLSNTATVEIIIDINDFDINWMIYCKSTLASVRPIYYFAPPNTIQSSLVLPHPKMLPSTSACRWIGCHETSTEWYRCLDHSPPARR